MEVFDFKCMDCGKNFEVLIEGKSHEFDCPDCKQTWKIELGRWFTKFYKKIG
ncbi:MAG: zinc ribbon domain-containing protein [Candidatus Aenigmarchaeota archaeon]|nr:zinc ribbon domain-containing protein [Candidatus Aenigmarchaeota archaeon]